MFEHYNEYYENYRKYLITIGAQLNGSEMETTFSNHEILIENVYGRQLPCKYSARYSSVEDKAIFIDYSVETDRIYDKTKFMTFSDCMYREYALVDTIRKIGHYILFSSSAYIFTDYGLIRIYGYNGGDNSNVSKLTLIEAWLESEECKDKIEAFINDNLVPIVCENKQRNLSVCTSGSYGFSKSSIEVRPFDCDIKRNYNDDIPYDRLMELINSPEEELILLHGEPGTGKTSIIKKLIYDNPKVEFIYFDFKLLTSFSDTRIFDFLSEHKQHVFIIEDCEKLFTNRNNGNEFLNSMLNLTDGIIGEAFGIKFVCTFNCPPSEIDKAVMRKGRLSLIYEFKRLSLEKTKAILPTATEPMTLAQLYNSDDNGNNDNSKRIGF